VEYEMKLLAMRIPISFSADEASRRSFVRADGDGRPDQASRPYKVNA
jgi:hypothetical protein